MATFTSSLGSKLQTKDGLVETSDALAGKIVGLYFSAHWCPPCRGFTPKLGEAYTKYKALGKQLEIVFVSSDNSETEFDEYFAEQPWLALPYAARDEKAALSKKYKVSGIPTFVILDESGELITKDGRSEIMEDPEGKRFPWKPKPLSELIPQLVEDKGGALIKSSDFDKKHLGLYFSAHWCPPCRGFTPKLVEFYNDITGGSTRVPKDSLEIMFVSSDRDEKAFKEYFGEMPWKTLPYADRDAKSALSKYFDVSGIPSFVMLSPVDEKTGQRAIITTSARGGVEAAVKDKTGDSYLEFPFYPKPVAELSEGVECNGLDINESPRADRPLRARRRRRAGGRQGRGRRRREGGRG